MVNADARLPGRYEPTNGRVWKLIGAGSAALYGLYRVFVDPSTGDAILGFFISFCLLIGELNFPSGYISRSIGGNLVVPLRTFFGYGDVYARILMVIIAVGGTALVIKFFFGLRLIPDSVDFVVKRLGVALTGVTVAIYLAMIVSKLSFELSHIRYDASIIRNELSFYVSITSFCILFVLGTGGTGIWDKLASHSDAERVPPFLWGDFTWYVIYCLCTISVIWSICFGLNVLSRIFEYYRRDQLEANEPVTTKTGSSAQKDQRQ